MKLRLLVLLPVAVVLGVVLLRLPAITTVQKEVICPVSGTKNTFTGYASWGSYIYHAPSKFQFIYFPHTWDTSYWTCTECHFSQYLGDFEQFPPELVPEARKVLAAVQMPEVERYNEIPIDQRIEAAEKMYELLGKDDAFWAHFYRVKGYYLHRKGKAVAASEARWKAVHRVEKLMQDPAEAGHRREHLLVRGAMRHFLGDDEGGLRDFHEAKTLEYADPKLDPERAKGYNAYLASLLEEYIAAIESGDFPRDAAGE